MPRLNSAQAFLRITLTSQTKRFSLRCYTCTMDSSKIIPLPDGITMPSVGLGTWKIPKDRTSFVVNEALKMGYRALDCACDYGNEVEVGEGLASAIEDGVVSRSDVFVTSKLWNTYHRAEHVPQALQRTLNDLKLDYLDLYLIHFPISLKFVPFEKRYPPEWQHDPETQEGRTLIVDNDAPLHETWRALEKEVDAGRVRAIGVCNYPVALLMELLKYARIKPVMLQVELHPYLVQNKLLSFCKRNDIAVTAFSPFGSSSYIELDMDVGLGRGALDDPVITEIASRTGKTVAQVLLRWGIQRGTAVIPKSSKIERLRENIAVFDFKLSEDDMSRISQLDRELRFNDPGVFCEGMGFSIPIYN